jgi:hypothetical protein
MATARFNPSALSMPTIRKGDSGGAVKILQDTLHRVWASEGWEPSIGSFEQPGVFDHRTDYAVKLYQVRKGLARDGVVGPKTWGSLGYKSSGSTGSTKISYSPVSTGQFQLAQTPALAPEGGAMPFYRKPWFVPIAIGGAILMLGGVALIMVASSESSNKRASRRPQSPRLQLAEGEAA